MLWNGLSATLRTGWRLEARIVGERTPSAPALSPADDPANHGGQVIDAGLGLAWRTAAGMLQLEGAQPLWARVRGVQLTPRTRWTLAWSRAL
jgi:hypothetical protein